MLNRLAIKLEINKRKSAIKSMVYRTFIFYYLEK